MPLLWLSLAFLLGILLGDWVKIPAVFWLGFALAALVLMVISRGIRSVVERKGYAAQWMEGLNSRLPRLPETFRISVPTGVLFFVLALGAARYQFTLPEVGPGHIAWYNDGEGKFTVEGLVKAPPDVRDEYTNLRVRAEQVRPADDLIFTPVEGDLLARVPPGGEWRYGDRVHLWGYLETPGENEIFSYRDYLARKGVYTQFDCGGCVTCENARQNCARRLGRDQGNPLLARIYALRQRSLVLLYELFPDPEASLLAGILLGIESGIPENVAEAFLVTGTSHIIVISGFKNPLTQIAQFQNHLLRLQ